MCTQSQRVRLLHYVNVIDSQRTVLVVLDAVPHYAIAVCVVHCLLIADNIHMYVYITYGTVYYSTLRFYTVTNV